MSRFHGKITPPVSPPGAPLILPVTKTTSSSSNMTPSGQVHVPGAWHSVMFGPGLPITPLAPMSPVETAEPRSFDYIPMINATITPRIGYGLLSFAEIREIYNIIPEVQLAVSVLINELGAFIPSIVDDNGNPLEDKDARKLEWLTRNPDMVLPWRSWLALFCQNVLVYDAPAVYLTPDPEGMPTALRVIDGSTLFVLVDEKGRSPTGTYYDPEVVNPDGSKGAILPAPAYVQIIQGMPYRYYSKRDIWYRPRMPVLNAPYGRTPIERCLPWIVLLANLEGYEIAWYREGTMPEQILAAPEDWTPEQVLEYEAMFNAKLAGNLGERRRIRFVPNGMTSVSTKDAVWREDLYKQARDAVLLAFGVTPTEIGDTPHEGLGGSGYAKAMGQVYYRMGILPLARFVEDFFNDMLAALGYSGYQFILKMPTDSPDPEQVRQETIYLFQNGLLSVNQAMERQKLAALPEGAGGDKHLLVIGSNVYVLEDILQHGEAAVPATPIGKPEKEALLIAPSTEDLQKRFERLLTGVEPEADRLYRAPVTPIDDADFPWQGANKNFQVIVQADKSRVVTGIFKPESGENQELRNWIGGMLYCREESAWRLDRSLGLYLVPTTWIARLGDEWGSVQIYVKLHRVRDEVETYAPAWIERAAVLDYISGQVDRGAHNWLTHPYIDSRPILVDNGLSFPIFDLPIHSGFVSAWRGKKVSTQLIERVERLIGNSRFWRGLEGLISEEGERATALALARAKEIVQYGGIPPEKEVTHGAV